MPTPDEDAAIAAGIAQDPDTYEPDWVRVKRESAANVPIDDQTGPYDPKDTAAVSVYWQQATITTPNIQAIQAPQQATGQYMPLKQVTKPNLTTAEAAFYLNRRPQTLRSVFFLTLGLLNSLLCAAQADCNPSPIDNTKVVARGPIKTVVGPLAAFDPCHKSVKLDTPTFFAKKRGDKPPLVIIAHGGGGLGGYERDFAKLMNQNGYATLIFDAFEMNGLVPGSDLLIYQMSNGGRQRMIYKVTEGAYKWALNNEKIDTRKIFFQGLSNGASVSINMAASADSAHVRGVVAEGGPSAGIGFPNDIKIPLLLIYGSADNYGGVQQDDFMYLRGNPCSYNDHYPRAPAGFSETCHWAVNKTDSMPSPYAWYQQIKANGGVIQFELIPGGGHGMMFSEFNASVRVLENGRSFYRAHGVNAEARQRLQQMVLEFFESKL